MVDVKVDPCCRRAAGGSDQLAGPKRDVDLGGAVLVEAPVTDGVRLGALVEGDPTEGTCKARHMREEDGDLSARSEVHVVIGIADLAIGRLHLPPDPEGGQVARCKKVDDLGRGGAVAGPAGDDEVDMFARKGIGGTERDNVRALVRPDQRDRKECPRPTAWHGGLHAMELAGGGWLR